jgi:hypothetical protein
VLCKQRLGFFFITGRNATFRVQSQDIARNRPTSRMNRKIFICISPWEYNVRSHHPNKYNYHHPYCGIETDVYLNKQIMNNYCSFDNVIWCILSATQSQILTLNTSDKRFWSSKVKSKIMEKNRATASLNDQVKPCNSAVRIHNSAIKSCVSIQNDYTQNMFFRFDLREMNAMCRWK